MRWGPGGGPGGNPGKAPSRSLGHWCITGSVTLGSSSESRFANPQYAASREARILSLHMYAAQSLVRVCKRVHACASVCVPAQRPVRSVRSQCIHHSPRLGTVPGPVTVSGAGWRACSLQWQPAAPPRVTSGDHQGPRASSRGSERSKQFLLHQQDAICFSSLITWCLEEHSRSPGTRHRCGLTEGADRNPRLSSAP